MDSKSSDSKPALTVRERLLRGLPGGILFAILFVFAQDSTGWTRTILGALAGGILIFSLIWARTPEPSRADTSVRIVGGMLLFGTLMTLRYNIESVWGRDLAAAAVGVAIVLILNLRRSQPVRRATW